MCRVFVWGEASRYQNYKRAVELAGGKVCFSTRLEDQEHCDGLLLPGGGDLEPWRYGQPRKSAWGLEPERDQAEMTLLGNFTRTGRPVLGICRGLQAVNVFFGGTLVQDLPGHGTVEGADRVHQVYMGPSFLMELYGPSGRVNSAHHQAVDRLGEGLRAVQWAEDGVIEGVCHEALPVWGVQWHPERCRTADGGRLFRAYLSLCGESTGGT